MSDHFVPESGQCVFSAQPWHPLAVPDHLEHALVFLSYLLPGELRDSNPFDNTASAFECGTFAVRAYSWDDEEEQEWNFAWRDLRVSWYKYLGRGMSMNRKMTKDDVCDMMIECLTAMRSKEDNSTIASISMFEQVREKGADDE
jgi:hypothetical protein